MLNFLKTSYNTLLSYSNTLFSKLKSKVSNWLLLSSDSSDLKKEKLDFSLKQKGNHIDYVMIFIKNSFSYELYISHLKSLEDKFCLDKNIVRLSIEAICYTKDTDKVSIFELPRSYTLYEDTYSEELSKMYIDLLSLSEKYTVEKLSSIRLRIDLYNKSYRLHKSHTA